MALEIERKFLLLSDEYKAASTSKRIIQGYICSDKNRVVRVRIYGEKAYITIKNATIGFARNEFEYAIPVEDAQVMLAEICEKPIIEKVRHRYDYKGFCWEIDEFHGENEGLVMAEIEFPSVDCVFEKPPFIGEEVTNDTRYYNASLIRNPYKNWK